ncbi:unnamed protein product [Thlaspi arvense]|uniref:MSP domain-containing protein n=1 Tax=Thlaspi arvense TaxID=13288 RepID=A0AAU9RT26_THLAR|nr:unnamed protein product [Thlaspi arvense]
MKVVYTNLPFFINDDHHSLSLYTGERKESPMSNELLTFDPVDVQFPFELKKQITCSICLTNKTRNYVAFKAKTTKPKQYCVRPNVGVVLPRSSLEVLVTMQAPKEAPVNMQCKDKFMFQCVVARPGATAEEVTSEMFSKEAGHRVEETTLKTIYVAPSPVQEGSKESSSPRASVSHNPSDLLIIDPVDVRFPFELKKQITCSLYLTNKTGNYVAFKAKTTNAKQYWVRPNVGVLLPRSSLEVLVTMQAQKEAPVNMQCKEKFLFQCVVARPGATAEEVTSEMFSKEAGHRVEETKLKVIYVAPPQPPSPVQERSKEGSSQGASVSHNPSDFTAEMLRSLMIPLFDESKFVDSIVREVKKVLIKIYTEKGEL